MDSSRPFHIALQKIIDNLHARLSAKQIVNMTQFQMALAEVTMVSDAEPSVAAFYLRELRNTMELNFKLESLDAIVDDALDKE